VLEDVGSWPSWAPTFTAVEPAGPLQVGTDVRITQPGRGSATYQVEVLEPGRRFQWGSAGRAVVQHADHLVEPTSPDACRVTLSFEMSGWLGTVLGAVASRKIRSMVDSEAESLARHVTADGA
jgi:hypothetical protein